MVEILMFADFGVLGSTFLKTSEISGHLGGKHPEMVEISKTARQSLQ